MTAKILDGKSLSQTFKERLTVKVQKIRKTGNSPPQLSVILVGDDPASLTYVKSKSRACETIGLDSFTYHLPKDTKQQEVLSLLEKLNDDHSVSGILVQLPLPAHFDKDEVIKNISPEKDVDGLHPVSVGNLVKNKTGTLVPCTPAGIIALLDNNKIEIEGKRAVVIGRSDIVGKPVAMLLLHRNATVTMCHSKTNGLDNISREADILIAAIGKPNFVKKSFIKQDAIVIDVGVNRVLKEEAWDALLVPESKSYKDFEKKGYTLVGDVDFDAAYEIAGAITPVPGGVGPMTISMLLKNTIQAYCCQKGIFLDENE
ncbi:MAG: bifunctional 5,10-methylene-tetrahydrofolate dehydrogenase/5,10-methylene-tetrahydrofolate cyclohydrolase [Candidatus Schekmanbacteria bacterium RBG_13_48_7]|uniref:Bifunctional protein FolD n=1 Tax=Candidatus Schekmanbacteria bacterium RBG_13_48_7 TaxID=1817878 RepID=A0A1F7S5H9_9BACT|nr:MAG: bifunctional 5,10-methylene-tetrahydrofolate dehydrogenase/5,10-methylene-tetrahydrofolate cyclohydrolase [Candidatus Schekmanbacteria bacterium RBG_13_48_7]